MMQFSYRCFIFLVIVKSLRYTAISGNAMNTSETQFILKKLFHNRPYINSSLPAKPGHVVTVNFSLKIDNMIPLDSFFNHISIEGSILQSWVDERLRFNSSVPNATIVLSGAGVRSIWLPDVWIQAERQASSENNINKLSLLHINSNGHVSFTSRLTVNIFCPMNYSKFPFDLQVCELKFESFGYSSKSMRLLPSDPALVIIKEHFVLSKFIYENSETSLGKAYYGQDGSFDQVLIKIYLHRDVRYYLMEYYFPLAFVVSASWISFWLDHKCIPARTGLPVTTFLTLISIAENIRSRDFSFQAYSTAVEVYISVCTFYVFAAVIEYAVVRATCQSKERCDVEKAGEKTSDGFGIYEDASDKDGEKSDEEGLDESFEELSSDILMSDDKYENEDIPQLEYDELSDEEEIHCHIVDRYSRIIFPTTFILFNIVYMLTCMLRH